MKSFRTYLSSVSSIPPEPDDFSKINLHMKEGWISYETNNQVLVIMSIDDYYTLFNTHWRAHERI